MKGIILLALISLSVLFATADAAPCTNKNADDACTYSGDLSGICTCIQPGNPCILYCHPDEPPSQKK